MQASVGHHSTLVMGALLGTESMWMSQGKPKA